MAAALHSADLMADVTFQGPERAPAPAHEPPLDDEELHRKKTAELAKLLAERLAMLARKEVRLAREEARLDLRKATEGSEFAIAGMVLGVCALCCGLVFAILALGRAALGPMWIALIGFVLFALCAAAFGHEAFADLTHLKPLRSMRQARQTADLLRRPIGHPVGHPVGHPIGHST